MPALSMSCVNILPALLNLRAYNNNEKLPFPDHPIKFSTIRPLPKDKKPRLKVGDEVKIYWKQRTTPKNSWFCGGCGKISEVATTTNRKIGFVICSERPSLYAVFAVFPKLITTVKITKVDIIEMWMGNGEPLITGNTLRETKKIARIDGFRHHLQFMKFFIDNYNLKEPKKFVRYYWG